MLKSILIVNFIRCKYIRKKPTRQKVNYKYRFEHCMEFFKIMLVLSATLSLGLNFGIFHCNYTSFFPTVLEIYTTFWMITLIKDYVVMYWVHPWMHKEENYWLHKTHHSFRSEVQVIHAFVIDTFDGFIESFTSPFLYALLLYVIYGSAEIHICGFFMTGWADVIVHSLNPFQLFILIQFWSTSRSQISSIICIIF